MRLLISNVKSKVKWIQKKRIRATHKNILQNTRLGNTQYKWSEIT